MRPFDENARKTLVAFLTKVMDENKLSNSDVAMKLSCSANQISWLKNPTYWKVVPQKVWDGLYNWMDDVNLKDKDTSLPTIRKLVEERHAQKIVIEKGIPIPEVILKGSKFPFDDMEIMDSFAIPIEEMTEQGKIVHNSSSISTAAGHFCRTHKGRKFVVRLLRKEGIIRCWRTE